MPVTLEDQLVVAISSRALFNFEEENRVFEQSDDRAYVQLQRERLQQLEARVEALEQAQSAARAGNSEHA